MTPWLGTPTSYASGYISAQRVVSSSPPGPWPPTFQSLTVELSSPPTYWIGLLTRSSRGSRALKSDSPGIPPWYVRPGRARKRCGRMPRGGVGARHAWTDERSERSERAEEGRRDVRARRTRAGGASPRDSVHRLELGPVLLGGGRAAQLHARREVTGLDREVVVEDGELLDRLPPVEAGVEPVDVALHERPRLRRRHHLGVGPALEADGRRPRGHRVRVERDEGRRVVVAGAVDEELADERAQPLEARLDLGRRDVLAARGLEDVLLAVGDVEEAALVDAPDVAGVEPAVLGEHLGRRLGVVVVAAHDARPSDEDLAVLLRDAHLGARQRPADRAVLVRAVVGCVDGRAGRRLGQAVALLDEQADRAEPPRDVGVERRGPADHEAHAAAETLLDLLQHEPGREPVAALQAGRRPLAAGLNVAHLAADGEGPVDEALLEARLSGEHQHDPAVRLLEDARGPGHEGRLDDG